MNEPLVTVITPSYNQGEFIRATIDSVLSQDYNHIEYLIIDGGSTDSTLDVLRSCTDPRLTWISEKDKGQSDAINKGLKLAKSDILTYLNSDDLLLPSSIKFVVEYFMQNPTADLVYGDCQFIDAEGERVGVVNAFPFDLKRLILGTQILSQPGAFWRRRVTEQIGYMDETLHYTMDVDYWLRAALAGFHLQYVTGVRSAFRLHAASKTVSQQSKFWDDWATMLDKAYASDEAAPIATFKQAAYQRLTWNRLKERWLSGDYNVADLKPFLRQGTAKRRFIALVMFVEAYTRIPLLRWAYAAGFVLQRRRLF